MKTVSVHFCASIILFATTLIFNGCILDRIFRVKNQLCDFEKNFQIEISEGFRVLLHDPVMLDDDVTWLAGAEPSERNYVGNELVMTYIAEKRGLLSSGQYDIPVELRFVRVDEEYRLKEGYLSKNLSAILTDELLTQIMQSVCRSEKSLAKQQIIVDIRSLNRSLLPAKSEIIQILGPSNRNSGNDHMLAYDYVLKNNDVLDNVAVIEIQFDRLDERILRIKLKYLRYHLDADFEEGKAVLKVDVFIDEKT
ncbi:MAG: hypothetical protein JSW26_13920 [Desulfobacterales bacterium]|nr:MAG: hypothetical protein JSW26_13920 [Desulfobacterales bacterium]